MADMTVTEKKTVDIDEMLVIVGEYGWFQRIVNLILCILTLPPVYHIMMMYFAADDPSWRCTKNSSKCNFGGTFSNQNTTRCGMKRSDWEYTEPSEYSLVTYFDVNCDDKWLLEVLTSIFFLGWLLGAFVLGWFCDNYGRKLVLIIASNVVMVTGFICIFLPSLYYIIVARFIIGFFLPGTMIQSFIIITEIVGSKYRPFSGLMIFVFGISGLTLIGVKAYYLQNWKKLHLYCTAPYLVVVIFYKFLPESVRYLRVKGKMDELMICFRRIAYWNNTVIPPDTQVTAPPKEATQHKSNPLHLFRTRPLATKTLIQTFAYFTTGLVYYGVFLAAGDIGGSLYRDYIIISGMEIPVIFISMDFCERFGRKKTSTIPMVFTCIACIAISFIPKEGTLKMVRVVMGMIGKCMVGSNMNTMCSWSTELYSTQVRGEAIGFFQAFIRLGAAVAPWLDHEFVKIHKSASFLFMAAISLASFCLLNFLPETQGTHIADTEDEVGQDELTATSENDLELVVTNGNMKVSAQNNSAQNNSAQCYANNGLEMTD